MKRDADLIRAIALATESLENGESLTSMPDVNPHKFAAHVRLMIDAGLIEGQIVQFIGMEPPAAIVLRLTWDGCDFMDAARNENLWKKAKDSVIAPTASWTFDILKQWLKTEILNGLPSLI